MVHHLRLGCLPVLAAVVILAFGSFSPVQATVGTIPSTPAGGKPPNYVIILADDAGYNDVGVFGSPTIRTPNLDRMAMEGTRFTQFYAGAPVCSPSRASMLTGRLPIRIGAYTNQSYPLDNFFRVFLPSSVGCLPENETTVATMLDKAGYYTALVGKWHIGHNPHRNCLPTRKGFDYFYGLPYSHEEGFPGPEFPESIVFPPMPLFQNEEIIEQPVNLETLTPRYTAQVLDMLDMLAGRNASGSPLPNPISPAPAADQPFFLYVGYEEAHVPLFAATDFQNRSRRGHYGDAMEQMDNSIGQILNKLRTTGLDTNTYVIFSSDNGAWIDPGTGLSSGDPLDGGSNAPFRGGKGSTWEGGLREPAILWAPGRIPSGQSIIDPVSLMDLMPTFLELANQPVPTNLDGRSLVPLLNGTGPGPHEFFYFWRAMDLYAVRYGPWKAHFITRPGFGFEAPVKHDPPLLFQVEHDPAEAHPVNVTTQPEVLQTILAAAKAHIASMVPGPSEYEANDWSLVPCCGHKYNTTQAAQFAKEGKFGLAIWDECVCSPYTDRPAA